MFIRHRLYRICWAPSDAGGGAPPAPAAAPAPSAPASAAPAAMPAPSAAPAAAPTAPAAPVAFAEMLPEAIRGEAAFRDIKDLDGLARSYLNAQKMIGHDPKNLMVIPAADDAEAWAAVHARLGRPEKPDGYQVKPPEGVQVDTGLQTGFLAEAHAAGLNQRQVEQLYAWWNNTAQSAGTERAAAAAAALETNITALKSEWGAAFDQNIDLANKAVVHYGGEKLHAELTQSGLANSPEMVRMLAKLGTQLSEDGIIGKGGATSLTKSPGEALQEINSLKADKAFMKAYTSKRDPGHADAMARMTGLYQLAFPETGR